MSKTKFTTNRAPAGQASPDRAPVDRAAGGIVLHDDKVLVVHRPRYDDWSLPKGHIDSGETWQQTAIREVYEETGVRAVIVSEPYPVTYLLPRNRPTNKRDQAPADSMPGDSTPDDSTASTAALPKLVLFYVMRCDSDPTELCGDPKEVDQVQWWSITEATQNLSYEVERQVICEALAAAPASPAPADPASTDPAPTNHE